MLTAATVGAWFLLGGAPETRLSLPATFGGQPKDPGRSDEPSADVDDDLRKIVPAATESMNGIYGDTGSTGGGLLIGGLNGPIEDPDAVLDGYIREFGGNADSESQLRGLRPVDPGPLGGKARCGSVTTSVSSSRTLEREVCIWANNTVFGLMAAGPDHAVVKNFVRLRSEVEHRV